MADRFDLINFGKSVVTTTGGTTANVNIDANTLFIDGTNNRVGIGTSSPITQLAVVGGAMQFSPGTSAQEGVRIQRAAGVCTFSGINNDNNTFNGLAFFTGASEAIRIDTGGRVITPLQPAFFAYPNTNGNLGSGTFVFSLTAFNIGSHYNTSNGRFTAPVAGLYHFSYGIQHNAGVSDNNWTDLQVNGSQYMSAVRAELFTSSTFHVVTASATIYLNASDFVTISSAGTGWGDNSWFSGHFVG